MSYVGSSAAVIPVGFSGVNSQSFNGDGSTVAFTLNRPVSAVNAIEVMVNNVQQSPYDGSYSVSSTTLTFSAAPSSGTANIYVVYRDFPVGSITDTGAVQKTGDTMTGDLIVDTNVGIGTSSPTDKLTVSNGGIVVNGGNVKVTDGSTAFQMGVNNFATGYGMGTTSNTPLIFAANGSERLRILPTGGITFNGDTAAANALDDYEEGTWTPALSFGAATTGITYSIQSGGYVKVGGQVTVWARLALSNRGSATGAVRVTGLPFTNVNAPGRSEGATAAFNFWVSMAGTPIPLGYVQNNNTTIYLVNGVASNSIASLSESNFSNSSSVYFNATYSTV